MPDSPTPAEVRARMSAQISREFNALVDQGAITGVDKIPMPDAPAAAVPAAPVVPAAAAPTAPAAAPATASVPAASEPAAVPFDREIHGLGKYNTMEELRKGYFNAVNTLSSTLDELSSLRQQPAANPPAAIVPASVPGGSPRVNPAARNPIDFTADPVLKQFAEESTIAPELLIQAIDRVATIRAEQIADERVDARIIPLQQMSEAESQMRQRYPDSVNHITEVGNYLKVNRDEAETVTALFQAGKSFKAMEYAYKAYREHLGTVEEKKMVANAAVAEEERTAARAAAGLPTSPNTGVLAARPNVNEAPTREEIAALNEAAGHGLSQDHAAVIRRRRLLGTLLPDHLRTWEQR